MPPKVFCELLFLWAIFLSSVFHLECVFVERKSWTQSNKKSLYCHKKELRTLW